MNNVIESTNEHIKKYPSIVRYGKKGTEFQEGDRIVIYEKLDGANAAFTRIGDQLVAYSRNTRLDEHNNLRGFYQFVQSLDVNDFDVDLIYYGEWLVRHKLDYGENMNKFYLFDIYDMSMGKDFGGFIDHQYVRIEAFELGLTLAPIFYEGPYVSEEHIFSFVGQSKLGEVGEGVVVKCAKRQKAAKFVSEAFAEMKGVKASKPKSIPNEALFVQRFITEARVEKMLHKLVDEGVLEEGFGFEDMRTILKTLGERIFEDVMKEESDELQEGYSEKAIRSSIGKIIAPMVRKVILSK